jgi:hypothetical protein
MAGFQNKPVWSVGSDYPTDLAVADLNNDGLKDILLAAADIGKKKVSGKVVMFLQQKTGFPVKADREFAFQLPRGVAAGDFDHDGKADFAVAENTHLLYVYPGKDNFNTKYSSNNINQYQVGVCTGKLSKGGQDNFLCGPVWRSWTGGDKFSAGYFYPPKGEKYNTNGIITDLNEDGAPDIVFASEKNIRVYMGPFSLQYRMRPEQMAGFYNLAVPVTPNSIEIADVNNDGLRDIVFCGGVKDKAHGVMAYLQGRFGGFDKQAAPVVLLKGMSGSLVAEDLNGDKITDLIVADLSWSKPQVSVFIATSDGIKGSPAQVMKPSVKQIMFIRTADINNDGKPDLLVAGNDRLQIYLGE